MKTKICSNPKCKKEKSISKFSKNKNSPDGYSYWCKKCLKEYYLQNKEKILKQKKERNKKYPWKKIFQDIKQRCNNPKDTNYEWYGLKGTQCLIIESQVKFLWFRDKAYEMKKPSIDRKNNNKNYTLNNCRFIEQSENSKKDKYKPILQYSLDGKFIREFKSLLEAEQRLNIDSGTICQCAKRNPNNKTAGGYKWRYKNV